MTDKELKRLSRVELLEMLVETARENENLQNLLKEKEEQHQKQINVINSDFNQRMEVLQEQLDEKKLAISKAGSIAEACLQINGIFEAAQASVEQYLINIRNQEELCHEIEKAAEENAKKKIAEVESEAGKYLAESKTKAAKMLADAEEQATKIVSDAQIRSSQYWEEVSQRLVAFYKEHQGLKDLMRVDSGCSK